MKTNSHARVTLRVDAEHWPMKAPFRITGYTFENLNLVKVTLTRNGVQGVGEAAGVYYFQDDVARMQAEIAAVRAEIEAGVDRQFLQRLLPPGGARNAVDCAMWDLEAKLSGRPVWELAGLQKPRALVTTFTVGADEPAKMAAAAVAYTQAKAIKLKLTGQPMDAERVRTVRAARPDVWLGVDANQGFTRASLEALLPALVESNVELIEQPVPRGQEMQLDGMTSPIPLAADESVQSLSDIHAMGGRFQVINIKLDKCGGLTEGLAMARECQQLGLQVMVGNMTGTSLAMAPAFLLGQLCNVVDLDGPVFLRSDRSPGVVYEDGTIFSADEVWGAAEGVLTPA